MLVMTEERGAGTCCHTASHHHFRCSVSGFIPTRAAHCQLGFAAVDTHTFLL